METDGQEATTRPDDARLIRFRVADGSRPTTNPDYQSASTTWACKSLPSVKDSRNPVWS